MADRWQTHGPTGQGQPAGLVRMSSPHRHSPGLGQFEEREWEGPVEEFSQDRKRSKIRDGVHRNSSEMKSQLRVPRDHAGPSSFSWAKDPLVPSPNYCESNHSGERSSGDLVPDPCLSRALSMDKDMAPLGLSLRKSPSLVDLISRKLNHTGTVDHSLANPDSLATDAAKNQVEKCLVPSVTAQDKLKASNFPASSLKVGTWERTSRYEGDLVGKCYYAKRKLVWEVLEGGLKSKIEIQWAHISAMKASCRENLPGTLEIEVSQPPNFFRETNPQPRKHTQWDKTSDFTGGQATICKRHSLQFPEGVLNRHYEKLVQCDPRLKSLVDGAISLKSTPAIGNISWFMEKNQQHRPAVESSGLQNRFQVRDQNSSLVPQAQLHLLPGSGSVNHAGGLLYPKVETRSIELASPREVMESGVSDRNSPGDAVPGDDFIEHDNIDRSYPILTNFPGHELPDVKPGWSIFPWSEVGLPCQNAVSDLSPAPFGDCTATLSNEHGMTMAASVEQMSASLAEELQRPQSTSQTLEGSGLAEGNMFPWVGVPFPWDSVSGSGGTGTVAVGFNSRLSVVSKRSPTIDLLANIPGVASLPQLFETSQAHMGWHDPYPANFH